MPYELLSKDALKECHVGEILTGKKQKYADIQFDGKQKIFQLSASPLVSPFQAGVFQDDGTATRLNLELNIDENTQQVLEAFDTFFSEQIKKLAPGKTYHPLIQKHGDYPARIRCKVNAQGPNAARFWSADQTPLGNVRTVDTASKPVTACIVLSKVWLMGVSAGVTCELRAAVLHDNNIPLDVFPL